MDMSLAEVAPRFLTVADITNGFSASTKSSLALVTVSQLQKEEQVDHRLQP